MAEDATHVGHARNESSEFVRLGNGTREYPTEHVLNCRYGIKDLNLHIVLQVVLHVFLIVVLQGILVESIISTLIVYGLSTATLNGVFYCLNGSFLPERALSGGNHRDWIEFFVIFCSDDNLFVWADELSYTLNGRLLLAPTHLPTVFRVAHQTILK